MASWTEMNHDVQQRAAAEFGDAIEEVVEFRDELTLVVMPDQVEPLCSFLQQAGYNFLEDIVGDDLYPDFPRFAVSYHIYSLDHNHRVRVRALVEDPDEGPPTLRSLWPGAEWLETEVYDLMGITFPGNDKLRRLFLPEDWEGHPLRKDYPLGYEQVQFSFNWEAIGGRKPRPQE